MRKKDKAALLKKTFYNMWHDSTSPVYPKEWTGDMFQDKWHETLKEAREDVASSLEKIHQKETNYLNNKLNTNDKAQN